MKTTMRVLWIALASAALLAAAGCSGSLTGARDSASGLRAAAMADAAVAGYPQGALVARWPYLGARVIAYLVYRERNLSAPVAVVDGYTTSFVDPAGPLPRLGDVMETREVNIEIDESRGRVTRFDIRVSYDNSAADYYNGEMQFSRTSFSVNARRVPLQEGESVGYQVRTLYLSADPGEITAPIGHPEAYQLLLGALSAPTPRVTLIGPPMLVSPAEGQLPLTGVYRCARAPGATSYTLQLSPDPTFSAWRTLEVSATSDASYAQGMVTPGLLYSHALFRAGGPVYWRMGARADGQRAPTGWSDSAQSGWVFSATRVFILPPR